MPNPNTIRYSTATQSGALRKGNFYLGVTDQDYGPSENTGYFNGVTFSSGYMTYIWDGSQVRYNQIANDSALLSFLSSRSGTEFSSLTSSLVWSMTQSDIIIVNKNYENVPTNGLVMAYDASFLPGYPRTGNTLFDLSGVGGTSSILSGASLGSLNSTISFNGLSGAIQSSYGPQLNDFTVIVWFRSTQLSGFNYNRLVDKDFSTGLWIGRNAITGGSWGGGVREGSSPFGRYITLADYRWHMITSRRSGTTHTILGDGISISTSGTVPSTALSSTTFAFGNYSGSNNTQRLTGNMGQIFIYNRALSTSEILQAYQSTYTKYLCENIVTNGLVAHLDATSINSFVSSSNTWINVSGTASNATLINGATFSNTNGGSISLDGINDYVAFSSSSTVGREWTMSAWFNCFTQSSGENIFNVFSANSAEILYGSGLYVASLFGGSRYIGWYLDNNWRVTANNVWQVNTWTHLVATVQGRVHRYYVNGTLVMTYTSVGNPPVVSLGSVGRIYTGARYFPGRISQYLAYNRALTQQEILQNYNATKDRFFLSTDLDPDAVTHINNILSVTGSVVTDIERNALSTFFRKLKSIGVFNATNMPVLCPMLGRVNGANALNFFNASKPIVPHADYISSNLGFINNSSTTTRALRINEGQTTWGFNYMYYVAGFNVTWINQNNFDNGKQSYMVAGNFFRHLIDSASFIDLGSFFNQFNLISAGRIDQNNVYVRNGRGDYFLGITQSWGTNTFDFLDVTASAQGYVSIIVVVREATQAQYVEVNNAIIDYLTVIERWRN